MLLSSIFGAELERRVAALPVDPAARQEILSHRGQLGATAPPARLPPEKASAVRDAVAQSFVKGFQDLARLSAGLAVLAAACAFFWILPTGAPREQTPRPTP
jgi:hypothetical protein